MGTPLDGKGLPQHHPLGQERVKGLLLTGVCCLPHSFELILDDLFASLNLINLSWIQAYIPSLSGWSMTEVNQRIIKLITKKKSQRCI